MVGQRRGLATYACCLILFMMMFVKKVEAQSAELDLNFLEWLGQSAAVGEVGLDIETLLEQYESKQGVSEPDAADSDVEKEQ